LKEEQRNLAHELWEPASALLAAVTQFGDFTAARNLLVPDKLPDLMARIFNLAPLYTLLYGHLEGGYIPICFAPADSGYWLEIGAYTDPNDPHATIKARTSLLMEKYAGQWSIAAIRPFGLSEACTPARLIELSEGEEPDETLLGLLLGQIQAELRVDEPLDEVEELAVIKMSEGGFTVIEQAAAVRFWRDYLTQANPDVSSPDEWAAALEILIGAINGRQVSMLATSVAYGIPVYLIEARQQALMESIQAGLFDPRYSIFDRPAQVPEQQPSRPKWVRRS